MFKNRPGKTIFVLLFFALLTLFITYPVPFHLMGRLAGVEGEDALQHVWIAWWTKKALVDLGISPAQASLLYHPDGAYNPMLWVTPYPQVAALPALLLFGPAAGHNINLILSFILSGLSGWLLCYYLTGNALAALFGGLIFAFAPGRNAQATSHLAQVVNYSFPLYALYLFRLHREPGRRNALLCGFFLGWSMLINIVHIAYFVLPFTALFLIWVILRATLNNLPQVQKPRGYSPSFLKWLGIAFGLAALLSGPFLLPFVFEALAGRLGYLGMGGVEDYSTDLAAFFTPSPHHPLLGKLSFVREAGLAAIGLGNLQENIAYLGFVPLVLAFWGFRQRKGRLWAGFWLALGLLAGVLSLGPFLKIGGLRTGIPLPYATLQALPFYKWGRVPGRMNETVSLALAVLASFGVTALSQRWKTGARHLQKSRAPRSRDFVEVARTRGIFVALAAIILFEYMVMWPFPNMPTKVPEFVHRLAKERGDFAILYLPQWPIWLRRASNYAMYYQTAHGHPIVGGYVWRLPEGKEGTMKAFQELLFPPASEDIIPRLAGEEALRLLNRYRVRYVTLYKGLWEPEDEAAALDVLGMSLGPPLYDGPEMTAFAVPEAAPGEDIPPLQALSYGWYSVESAGGRPARWLENEGKLYVHLLQGGRYRLNFNVYPFNEPRHLQIEVNGKLLLEEIVAGWRTMATPTFTLEKGGNEITFHSLEGCQAPAEIDPKSLDRRCLSLLFQDVGLWRMGNGE